MGKLRAGGVACAGRQMSATPGVWTHPACARALLELAGLLSECGSGGASPAAGRLEMSHCEREGICA